ncbi:MAG: carboxypeptidase M32 [Planctomycetota bacterium]|nr:carboxypeptidase M32 [Planctomycetota bacterium]
MPADRRTRSARSSRPGRSTDEKAALTALAAELRRVAVFSSVGSLLGWDQETMMPARGAAHRAEQIQAVSSIAHEMRTSRKLGDLLAAAEDQAEAQGPAARAGLALVRRDYERARKLPSSLVAELARTASLGMEAWKGARQRSDFKAFLPWLRETIRLSREKAACYGPTPGASRRDFELYDALLEDYEPGMTAAQLRAIFGPLRARLVPLIAAVARADEPSLKPARRAFPIEQQKEFVRRVCAAIGFDFDAGRMDQSAHPFCDSMGPGDTRITNRYRDDGWTDALSTAMHEAGHAMYEQGLPKARHFGHPFAEAVSLGIHESQSRLWENLVGRSRPFWTWARSEAIAVFGSVVRRDTADDLYRAVNIVKPNLIRVESDELTYNLHIMLRFDLERAMVAQELDPADLPGEWNARLKSDLGLKVPDDRRGCLQDVHWSAGLVGYFPTYTLGNLYASQFWEKMGRDVPRREKLLEQGEFASVLAWLRKNIHAHGRRYTAAELCRRVTGAPLSHDALLRHLERKVLAVYGG